MASFSSNDIESALSRKGFRLDNGKHKYYFLFHNGVRTSIRTMVSHNHQDIGDNFRDAWLRKWGLIKSSSLVLLSAASLRRVIKKSFFKEQPPSVIFGHNSVSPSLRLPEAGAFSI
jgi:hypothetical protein